MVNYFNFFGSGSPISIDVGGVSSRFYSDLKLPHEGGARLLVIGGADVVPEIVNYANRRGVKIFTAGNDKSSPIHEVGAECSYIDVTDIEKLRSVIISKNIDGVFSCGNETVIMKTADFLRGLLPYYVTGKTWSALMNKANFQRLLELYNLPVIPSYSADVAHRFLPVVVKPVDSCGSSGVSKCESSDELSHAIDKAKSISFSDSYLIQPFLQGEYFQFDIYMKSGRAYFPYSKSKLMYEQKEGVNQQFLDIYPSRSHSFLKEFFLLKLERLLADVGLEDGSCFFEGIIQNGIPYIYDVACRLGGGMDYRVVLHNSGFSLVDSYLDYALGAGFGLGIDHARFEFGRRNYVTVCFGLRNGIIGRISGVDRVLMLPCVYSARQYYEVGDRILSTGRFAQTFLRVFVFSEDASELHEWIAYIVESVRVLDENGENMLLDPPCLRIIGNGS
ncbi:MAG: hypothetical protein PUD60_10110 [Akkermansia muciniphila]|nr:hypothetical protein [Akkermansia muciniphila]